MRDGYSLRDKFIEYLEIEKNASSYTIIYYKEDINAFLRFLKSEEISKIEDVDQRVVRVFLTTLYERDLARKSVSRTLSCLRSFYRFLERESIVVDNPFSHVTLPKQKKTIPNFFYEAEIVELFEVADLNSPLGQRNQALLEILYGTGIRVSECQAIQLSDIDFDIGTLLVLGKGQKERYVPFGQYARTALEAYINDGRNQLLKHKYNDTSYLFLNARGSQLTTRGIRYILTKIVKKAALALEIHPHKLRHTFATHMLNAGADLRTVQELLGHENLSSTQIYTHVTKDHLRSVYMNSHPRARIEK